jgi:hypothetical protein
MALGDGPCLNVAQDDRVGTYSSMCADSYPSENLRAGAYVNVARDFRQRESVAAAMAYSHLLEDQAIHANLGVGMDDNSVGVRNEQSSPDLAVKWDIRSGYNGPKAMAQDNHPSEASSDKSGLSTPLLITPYRQQELSSRIPKLGWSLSCPVRNVSAYQI